VIRFSAGLVVVAIGVLIGGVATSKLSLVYVAIAVSAVALVALAIGVALKRDELFGGGPESAAADAGAGSGMPVGELAAAHVRGIGGSVREDLEKIRPKGPATAAFEAAAAARSEAAPTVATPSVTTPPVTAETVAAPPVVNAPLGQRQPAFSQASTRVDETVADWDTRPAQPPWSSGEQGHATWTPREQASARPLAKEPQPGSAGAPAAPARGWANPADQSPPSWFDRLNQPVAEATAPATTNPPKPEPPKAEPPKAEAAKTEPPATSPAVDSVDADDDDWPTRYSWLEDDESEEAAKPAADVAEPDDAATTPDAEDHAAQAGDDVAAAADSESADVRLVTVIPGVPRYHDPDCILIRFMDDEDVARKSIPEAKAANCTPCAACQPEG
jgi:hypothetical protein